MSESKDPDVSDWWHSEIIDMEPGSIRHRFHPVDPRAPRLLELVDEAARGDVVSGRFASIGREVERRLALRQGKRIPTNIDGATVVI